MPAIIKHSWMTIWSFSTQCTSAWCNTVQLVYAAQNSRFHFSWAVAPTAQNWTRSIDYNKMWGVIQQREYELEPSSDWLNSGKTCTHQLNEKMRFSCFRVLPGSAEALVRWDGKNKSCLITNSLSNIRAKTYKIGWCFRVSKLRYSKSKVCRVWDTAYMDIQLYYLL